MVRSCVLGEVGTPGGLVSHPDRVMQPQRLATSIDAANDVASPPMIKTRLCAASALLLASAVIVFAAALAVANFPNGVSVLVCAVLALGAAWWGIRRLGAARVAGVTGAALLLAGAVVLIILEGQVLEDVLILAGFGLAIGAARTAFRVHVTLPATERPARPVLFYNPLSGGGKAERFQLASEAQRRGIEAIELSHGADLEQLVRAAVARGADALAMAGGDGSQAIVAAVAAEVGLPYACIPAGTRNHFALDLGVDRDDVVGALDAFVDGGERVVDVAEVNGRVFVNNVSLGLYAEAVQQPGYREAKLHTLLGTVPLVLGPNARPPELLWESPAGRESAAAILVSNNPYRLGRALGSGTRPRLDRGLLGITVLVPIKANGSASSARKLAMQRWTASRFEIDAHAQVDAGIDGEAIKLSPPIHFEIRPRALRVRIAPGHPGASPSALEPDRPWQMITALAGLAFRGRSADPVATR